VPGVTRIPSLHELIATTQWVDTHEHLIEERHRLEPAGYAFEIFSGWTATAPVDWTGLLFDYSARDLISAGMSMDDSMRLFEDDLSPLEKWALVEPYWAAVRHTGYLRAVDITTTTLFGQRLSASTCEAIDEAWRGLRRPGYFADVLRIAGIERSQVHTFDHDPFCESEYPDLLHQDLSINKLVLGRHERVEAESGIDVATLDDYVAVVEWCFGHYGPRAVAAKCAWAYLRPLQVEPVAAPPSDAFGRLRAGTATDADHVLVQDFLFDLCVRLATEHGLPMKIHLGYLDDIGNPMMLAVDGHVAAAMQLAQRYADTTFVLMHIAWPHPEPLLALAKHQPNVILDLCWAWILAPTTTREFVKRFLTSVPSNKLLCFGSDSMMIENVVGHAAIARAGIEAALTDLVGEGWMSVDDACALVAPLMRGNAERVFPTPTVAALGA
jgi:hypothetical protein